MKPGQFVYYICRAVTVSAMCQPRSRTGIRWREIRHSAYDLMLSRES